MALDLGRATIAALWFGGGRAMLKRELSPADRARSADTGPLGRNSARQSTLNSGNHTLLQITRQGSPPPRRPPSPTGKAEPENPSSVNPRRSRPPENRSRPEERGSGPIAGMPAIGKFAGLWTRRLSNSIKLAVSAPVTQPAASPPGMSIQRPEVTGTLGRAAAPSLRRQVSVDCACNSNLTARCLALATCREEPQHRRRAAALHPPAHASALLTAAVSLC